MSLSTPFYFRYMFVLTGICFAAARICVSLGISIIFFYVENNGEGEDSFFSCNVCKGLKGMCILRITWHNSCC